MANPVIPKHLAKEIQRQLFINAPPSYTLTRDCRNPFRIGQTIRTLGGVEVGVVTECNPESYAHWHWVRIADNLIVFDYRIGVAWTIDLYPKLPVPFAVGMRLFYTPVMGEYDQSKYPSFTGTVMQVDRVGEEFHAHVIGTSAALVYGAQLKYGTTVGSGRTYRTSPSTRVPTV